MQESQTEKGEMKQQQRMKVMRDMTRKIKSKDRIDANNSWCESELLVADCQKSVATQDRKTLCYNGTLGCMN